MTKLRNIFRQDPPAWLYVGAVTLMLAECIGLLALVALGVLP